MFDTDDKGSEAVDDLSSSNHLDSDGSDQESNSRRRFLKGAVATVPVIMTITSRPVWARNCTLSGQLSGNLSDQNDEECGGEGCSPGFWRNHKHLFHPAYPPEMLFDAAFGRNAFPGKTLGEVVEGKRQIAYSDMSLPAGCSSGNNCYNLLRELGFQAVAALQNSATPVSYDIDVATVITSFQMAYDTGALETTKDTFDTLNNQICNLGTSIY